MLRTYLLISLASLLTGCAAMPELFKAVDDIATDTAIKVEVDKEAFQKDTDVSVAVEVKNKDTAPVVQVQPAPATK
ncbi:hypothetical protein BN1013_02378 [Candidatus Rubidus massiliensis]|nr:hypothetical protein BN1013_02378 [Candidatus Rubidus massiliensis]